MHLSLSLLFFFLGSTSSEKIGDFGILTACLTKNQSLRLDCSYAKCSTSNTSFDCEFMTSTGSPLAVGSDGPCTLILPDHKRLNSNSSSTSYNCTLTRRKRKEKNQITIDYSLKGPS